MFSQRDLFQRVRPDVLHTVFYCAECDFFYMNPLSSDALSEYYPPVYYSRKPSRIRTYFRGRAVERRYGAKTSRLPDGSFGTFVDIGCGSGELLLELKRRGWKVIGTDWNELNAENVSTALQIPVYGGEAAWEKIEAESADVVSLFHVLEHDANPMELLHKVHRILKSGGRLIVGVPNAASLTRKLFGRHWMGYDIPRHRCAFSPKSLRNCLDLSGFKIDRFTGRVSDELLDLSGSCRLLWSDQKTMSAKFLLAASLPIIVFGSVLMPFPGSVMYAYAHKP